MSLVKDYKIKKVLKGPVGENVRVVTFLDYSQPSILIKELMEELSGKLDFVKWEPYSSSDIELAIDMGVTMFPAIAIPYGENKSIIYYGPPIKKELEPFLRTLKSISGRETDLSQDEEDLIASFEFPVWLRIFVTSSCPFCPKLVSLINQIALINNNISVDIIDIEVFPHIASMYRISAVPTLGINQAIYLKGQIPKTNLIMALIGIQSDLEEVMNRLPRARMDPLKIFLPNTMYELI